MSTKLNRETYEKLIEEDVAWLRTMPDTLQSDHIEQVLWWSIKALYPSQPGDLDVPKRVQYKLCRECGQPMKPKGVRKRPNEYDHAQGCRYATKPAP